MQVEQVEGEMRELLMEKEQSRKQFDSRLKKLSQAFADLQQDVWPQIRTFIDPQKITRLWWECDWTLIWNTCICGVCVLIAGKSLLQMSVYSFYSLFLWFTVWFLFFLSNQLSISQYLFLYLLCENVCRFTLNVQVFRPFHHVSGFGKLLINRKIYWKLWSNMEKVFTILWTQSKIS